MSYQVESELFEGPLDLLLSLIEKEKLDITELALAKICTQYHAYLKLMQEMDLDVESSYLVVLAELVEIKSRVLLPEEPAMPMLDDAWLEDAPPDDPLVIKLKEYKRIKDAAQKLSDREKEALSSFPRPSNARPVSDEKELADVSLVDLLDAIKGLLSQRGREPQGATVLHMRRVPLSVPQRMHQIWHAVDSRAGAVGFVELLADDATRADIIVSFLAILELARMRRVQLRQEGALGDIYVQRHPEASGPLVLSENADAGPVPEEANLPDDL